MIIDDEIWDVFKVYIDQTIEFLEVFEWEDKDTRMVHHILLNQLRSISDYDEDAEGNKEI